MSEITERLQLIKLSLTDSIDNPNFQKNREYALKQLTEVEKLVDSDSISNVRVSLVGEALECNYVDRKAKECLTNGKKYIVLADNERRGFKIKDDKNKTKWYRTFCYFRKPDSL